jgi:hypothetical protein
MIGTDYSGCKRREPQQLKTEALANAAKFTTGRAARPRSLGTRFDLASNYLILKHYLSPNCRRTDFAMIPLQAAAGTPNTGGRNPEKPEAFLIPVPKMPFASVNRFVY